MRLILLLAHQAELGYELKEFLAQRGYHVTTCERGGDLLDLMGQMEPDLILLDMYVSDPGGLEVLRKIREAGFRGKVILLAGSSARALLQKALQLGIDGVVGGPQVIGGYIDFEAIGSAVAELVGCPMQ